VASLGTAYLQLNSGIIIINTITIIVIIVGKTALMEP
jgi:hypothetical protein